MMSGTQSNFEGSLREFLAEMFLDTKRLKLAFDVEYIYDNIPDAKRKDTQYIRNLLKDMRGVTKLGMCRYGSPVRITSEMVAKDATITAEVGEIIWPTRKKNGRPYEFDAQYFLTASEYKDLTEWIETNRKGKEPEEAADPQAALFDEGHGWEDDPFV